jgi:pantothenate kinase, type III
LIIAFDVGNSEITIGLFEGEELVSHWRLTTAAQRTADELSLLIRSIIAADGRKTDSIQGAAICSVVPQLTPMLAQACKASFGKDPVFIDAAAGLPIQLDVEEPLTVGADRIANTLAASRIYKTDAIVVDMGTATTYDCVLADGTFFAGVIQPGIRVSANTLFTKTAQLAATDLIAPKSVMAKRTDECIRAGVLYGAVDSIDGLVRRIKAEWPNGNKPKVIATGGMAETIKPHSKELEIVDSFLTLKGIQIGYALLVRGSRAS